jgi:hypothetical protein
MTGSTMWSINASTVWSSPKIAAAHACRKDNSACQRWMLGRRGRPADFFRPDERITSVPGTLRRTGPLTRKSPSGSPSTWGNDEGRPFGRRRVHGEMESMLDQLQMPSGATSRSLQTLVMTWHRRKPISLRIGWICKWARSLQG